jgi:Ca2+-binding EF-hand superfamily protein
MSTNNLTKGWGSLGSLQSQLEKERLTGPNSAFWQQAQKFTQFKPEEIETFIQQFKTFDRDGNFSIDANELAQVCREVGKLLCCCGSNF